MPGRGMIFFFNELMSVYSLEFDEGQRISSLRINLQTISFNFLSRVCIL